MDRAIIPKDFSKRKFLIISKFNVSLMDLLALTIPAIFFLAMGYWAFTSIQSKPFKYIVLLIIISFSFIVILMLNSYNKEYEQKRWKTIWTILMFIFVHKKYNFGHKSYDTLNLIPYKATEEEFIKLKSKKANYVTFLKVLGNDFFKYDANKQEKILYCIWDVISFMGSHGSIIQLRETVKRNEVLFHLNEQIFNWKEKNKNGLINDKQYFSRLLTLEKEMERLKNVSGSINEEEPVYYLAFYSNDINELRSNENYIFETLSAREMHPVKLSKTDKMNIIYRILGPNTLEELSESFYKLGNGFEKFDNFLAFDELEVKNSFLNIFVNNEDNDENKKRKPDYKMSICSIKDFEFEPSASFATSYLNALDGLADCVIFNFEKQNEKVIQETLGKLRRQINATLEGLQATRSKEVVTIVKKQREQEEIEEIIQILGEESDNLYKFNVHCLFKSFNQFDLRQKIKLAKSNLKKNKLRLFRNFHNQFDSLSAIMPKPNDPLMETQGREIMQKAIALSNPFIKTTLFDKEGMFIGNTNNGDELFFNPHERNSERINSNMFVVATSGAGKSTSIKTLIVNEVLNGNKIYIIDPENEYEKLANYFGEDKIILGDGVSKINPLQIYPTLSEVNRNSQKIQLENNKTVWGIEYDKNDLVLDKYVSNEASIISHISEVETLFTSFVKNVEENVILYFAKQLHLFYIFYFEKIIRKVDISSLNNKDYPIFQDFYDWLIKNEVSKDNNNKQYYMKLINYLEAFFVESNKDNIKGKYSFLYNGKTTINIDKKYLVVFDLSSLRDRNDKTLLSVQMGLVIRMLEKQIKINNRLFPRLKQRIVVDEAHLLIDKDFPIALDFIFRMVKMIRKRNGGITIITQNPKDFIAEHEIEKKTTAIVNNSQSILILRLNPADINIIEEMISEKNTLSFQEKQEIRNSEVGKGLLIVDSNSRYSVNIDAARFFDIFNDNEINLEKFMNKKLAARIMNAFDQFDDMNIDSSNESDASEFSTVKKGKISKVDGDKYFIAINMNNSFNYNHDYLKNNIEIENIEWYNNTVTIIFSNKFKRVFENLYNLISEKYDILVNNYFNFFDFPDEGEKVNANNEEE